MKYRAFGDYRKGYAHVKNGSDVEDCAGSYNDPKGRYYIGVICDGHSDKNCFRSGKGAQFGCESALEILTRFFDLYYMQEDEKRSVPEGTQERLKRSIKQCWDNKVFQDIKDNPISDDDLAGLSERVREIYQSGSGLQNVYGATFLAVALCEDFFLALHIGDGVILCIDENGSYYYPLVQDPKSETGAPASLCDSDLFTRENAFRICLTKKIPQVATVSSDGIEDCMDPLGYKRFTQGLFRKLETMEISEQKDDELNGKQKAYLESCLEYYTGQGHGAEDDCSLAAIYSLDKSVPDMKIPPEEAMKLWNRTMEERNAVIREYETRKENLMKHIQKETGKPEYKGGSSVSMKDWIVTREKVEELKRTLKTVITNEKEKVAFFDQQLELYSKYIGTEKERISGFLAKEDIQEIDETLLEPDTKFMNLKNDRQNFKDQEKALQSVKQEFEEASKEVDAAYDDAKRVAKDFDFDTPERRASDNRIKRAEEKFKEAKAALKKAEDDVAALEEIYKKNKAGYSVKKPQDPKPKQQEPQSQEPKRQEPQKQQHQEPKYQEPRGQQVQEPKHQRQQNQEPKYQEPQPERDTRQVKRIHLGGGIYEDIRKKFPWDW